MSRSPSRRSPIHSALEASGAQFVSIGGAWLPWRIHDEQAEASRFRTLGLCDLSSLSKLGLKGANVESWLVDQRIEIPRGVFESCRLPDGGLVVRVGLDEFFLESGVQGKTTAVVEARSSGLVEGVSRVERQDATFVISGSRSREVLAQTCGIDFDTAEPWKVIFTRVAGTSCGLLPGDHRGVPVYRLWADPSYAVYLWNTLVEICDSLTRVPSPEVRSKRKANEPSLSRVPASELRSKRQANESDLNSCVIGARCLYPELKEDSDCRQSVPRSG